MNRWWSLCLWVGLAWDVPAADPLPALGADLSATSVSGVSSGGYMAVQFHVAHSALVKGVGALAAGPYYCAQGSAWTARYNCMRPGAWTAMPPIAVLKTQTEILARSGQIDPLANLQGARVWLFSGRRDETVRTPVVEALARYYESFVSPEQVALVQGLEAGHAMVTAQYGQACELTRRPYLNDCDFDAAGQLLTHVYDGLAAPAAPTANGLLSFDQREFAGGVPYAISMDDVGYVYVPHGCRQGSCRVHVAFHGCGQAAQAVGETFVREAGYNRWAQTNRIIVLYPQAIARYGWGPWPWPTSFAFNPSGCWDWWGYTGANYHTQAGAQIRAVKAMLDRLAQIGH